MIEHKNYEEPHWTTVDNISYRIGSHTFEFCGIIRIDGVEYNMDSPELRRVYREACEKREMWSKLNVEV